MTQERRSGMQNPNLQEHVLRLIREREERDSEFLPKYIRFFRDEHVTLIEEGKSNKEIWLIVPHDWFGWENLCRSPDCQGSGSLEILVQDQIVATLRRFTDFVGEISALLDRETIATVRACGVVKLLTFQVDDFSDDPEFSSALYSLFVSALREKLRMTFGLIGKQQLDYHTLKQQIDLFLDAQQAAEVRAQKAQEELDAFRRKFVYVLHHELTTRISPPQQFVAFACKAMEKEWEKVKKDDWEKAVTFVQGANQAFIPLRDAGENVKMAAQLLTEKKQLNKQSISLSVLLSPLFEKMRKKAEEKEVVFSVPDQIRGTLEADQCAMTIFTELMKNAVNMTPPNGYVTVSVEENQKLIFVHIADTGPGIAVQDLGSIFQLFIQSDRENQEQQGLGIGLFVAWKLCQLHGWEIAVQSELEKGSTFSISIPVLHE